MAELTMVEAINRTLAAEMRRDERIILLGEDVGADGGIFRVTTDLIDEFGEERVMDTPLAESGIVGFALGMAMRGLLPVPEIQFSGFAYLAFHQIESHLSRMRWRTQGGLSAPVVIRMPYGAGVRALEHHSESREAYYAHMPGLKTVIPSGPRNAAALLKASLRDPDPVVFLEPKASYRAFREETPEDDEPMPIGRAEIVRDGDDVTIVAYGAMLPRALEAAASMAEDGLEAEVIDLLTLSPLDWPAIAASARRTGRCVVVHEAPLSFGPGAEIAARVMENAFLKLRAPVARVTGADVNVPYFAREQRYLPDSKRIVAACRATMDY